MTSTLTHDHDTYMNHDRVFQLYTHRTCFVHKHRTLVKIEKGLPKTISHNHILINMITESLYQKYKLLAIN